jgi:hypothetical protein
VESSEERSAVGCRRCPSEEWRVVGDRVESIGGVGYRRFKTVNRH